MKFIGTLWILLLLGCGRGVHSEEGSPTPSVSLPQELQTAGLTCQRGEHIVIHDPIAASTPRELAKGIWPRWNADGTWIAFLQGTRICRVFPETGTVEILSEGRNPRTLAVPKVGTEIWYSDSGKVYAVDVTTKEIRVVTENFEPLEMDVVGNEILGTIKVFGGYRVRVRNVTTGEDLEVGTGCSASFSPDGSQVTRNERDHVRLALHDKISTDIQTHLTAPEGRKTDDQFWSNHPDWVVSMDEASGHIYAHRVSDNQVFRITAEGGGNRPDLWVP